MIQEDEVRTSLSTNICIETEINGHKPVMVGAIKSFVVNQSRNLMPQRDESGKITAFIPGETYTTIDVDRAIFDGMAITEAFIQPIKAFSSPHSTRDIGAIDWPFNIRVTEVNNHRKITTIYRNCWIREYTCNMKAEDYLIFDHAKIVCEKIETIRDAKTDIPDDCLDCGAKGYESCKDWCRNKE